MSTAYDNAMARRDAIARITEIDRMFESAKAWGSFMIPAANEREALATSYGLPHRFLARTSSGERTD